VTDGQTDGQTDGIAMAYTHYSIYAVARNKIQNGLLAYRGCPGKEAVKRT